jgi:polyisoprenoid-binding protein YceI
MAVSGSRFVRGFVIAVAGIGLALAPALSAPLAPKGTYTLDPAHTQIVFTVKHMGLSTFYGRFGKITGTLNFDQEAPEKSTLEVQIDTHAIDTHVPELDSSLPNSVFAADKYPSASFVSTAVAKTGEVTGTVTGNLSLAGVTKPVTLEVTFNGGRGSGGPLQPYRIGFDAKATLKRSDFGLTNMIWSGFVSDDVQLLIEAEAVRK